MLRLNKPILSGVIITLLGSFIYVLMGALSKITNKHLLINQIMFVQSISGLLCTCYLMKIKKYKWKHLLAKQKPINLVRIIMSLASIYTLIYGLQYISIFNALIIMNSAPLIIPLLRKIFFKHQIHTFILPSALLAFIGLVLILGPDKHIIDTHIIIIFISMLCMAFSLLILEKTQPTNPNLSIFYYFLYSSAVTGLIVLFQHQLFSIPLHYLGEGIMIGVLFFLVQLSVIYAAQYISSHLISVLFYSEIIIALFASIILEGMQFNNHLIVGTVLVMLGGLLVIFIENKIS
jgi:drug/metabolite transporter (DMT)-like permease